LSDLRVTPNSISIFLALDSLFCETTTDFHYFRFKLYLFFIQQQDLLVLEMFMKGEQLWPFFPTKTTEAIFGRNRHHGWHLSNPVFIVWLQKKDVIC